MAASRGLKETLIFYIGVFASALILINILVLHYDGRQQSAKQVDKDFFFDLLQQVDSTTTERSIPYSAALRNEISSQFYDVMDRGMLFRYLAERFGYSTFLQIGKCDEHIASFLPDSLIQKSRCVDTDISRDLDSRALSGQKFDIVLFDALNSVDSVVIEKSLGVLSRRGLVIIPEASIAPPHAATNLSAAFITNGLAALVSVRTKVDVDLATIDADGGLSVIMHRRNSMPLTLVPLKGASGYFRSSADKPVFISWDHFISNRVRMLNIMTFEAFHNWLVPSGSVDAVTAFGGERSIQVYRDSAIVTARCFHIFKATVKHDIRSKAIQGLDAAKIPAVTDAPNFKALDCFRDAASSDRLSLRGRLLYALLLLRNSRVVDAITTLNELYSLSPTWYRWLLQRAAIATARDLDPASLPEALTARGLKKRRGVVDVAQQDADVSVARLRAGYIGSVSKPINALNSMSVGRGGLQNGSLTTRRAGNTRRLWNDVQ